MFTFKRTRRRQFRRFQPKLESLETRQMMTSGLGTSDLIVAESTAGFEVATNSSQSSQPVAPLLTGPLGTIRDPKPTITWTEVPNAHHYDLWVNNYGTGEAQVIRQENLQSNSFTPIHDLPFGAYRGWVRTIDSAGRVSNWSQALDFTVSRLGTPLLIGPSQSASRMPTFRWHPVESATRYELWVNNTSTGEPKVIHESNLTNNWYSATNPLDAGGYRFWVRAFNDGGQQTGWSSAMNFQAAGACLANTHLTTWDVVTSSATATQIVGLANNHAIPGRNILDITGSGQIEVDEFRWNVTSSSGSANAPKVRITTSAGRASPGLISAVANHSVLPEVTYRTFTSGLTGDVVPESTWQFTNVVFSSFSSSESDSDSTPAIDEFSFDFEEVRFTQFDRNTGTIANQGTWNRASGNASSGGFGGQTNLQANYVLTVDDGSLHEIEVTSFEGALDAASGNQQGGHVNHFWFSVPTGIATAGLWTIVANGVTLPNMELSLRHPSANGLLEFGKLRFGNATVIAHQTVGSPGASSTDEITIEFDSIEQTSYAHDSTGAIVNQNTAMWNFHTGAMTSAGFGGQSISAPISGQSYLTFADGSQSQALEFHWGAMRLGGTFGQPTGSPSFEDVRFRTVAGAASAGILSAMATSQPQSELTFRTYVDNGSGVSSIESEWKFENAVITSYAKNDESAEDASHPSDEFTMRFDAVHITTFDHVTGQIVNQFQWNARTGTATGNGVVGLANLSADQVLIVDDGYQLSEFPILGHQWSSNSSGQVTDATDFIVTVPAGRAAPGFLKTLVQGQRLPHVSLAMRDTSANGLTETQRWDLQNVYVTRHSTSVNGVLGAEDEVHFQFESISHTAFQSQTSAIATNASWNVPSGALSAAGFGGGTIPTPVTGQNVVVFDDGSEVNALEMLWEEAMTNPLVSIGQSNPQLTFDVQMRVESGRASAGLLSAVVNQSVGSQLVFRSYESNGAGGAAVETEWKFTNVVINSFATEGTSVTESVPSTDLFSVQFDQVAVTFFDPLTGQVVSQSNWDRPGNTGSQLNMGIQGMIDARYVLTIDDGYSATELSVDAFGWSTAEAANLFSIQSRSGAATPAVIHGIATEQVFSSVSLSVRRPTTAGSEELIRWEFQNAVLISHRFHDSAESATSVDNFEFQFDSVTLIDQRAVCTVD